MKTAFPIPAIISQLEKMAIPEQGRIESDDSLKTILETDHFNSLFDKAILETLTGREKVILDYLVNYYHSALFEARKNNLNNAGFYFQYADQCLKESAMPGSRFNGFLRCTYLPARAYLSYKQKKFGEAIEQTQAAIDNDLALEKEGFEFLALHRVQQYHNICRVFMVQQKLDEAIDIAGATLDFLVAGSSSSPFFNTVKLNLLIPEIAALRASLIIQIMGEMYFMIASKTGYGSLEVNRRLFELSFRQPVYYSVCREDQVVNQWMKIHRLLYAGDMEGYLRETGIFIHSFNNKYDRMKYCLLMNLVYLTHEPGADWADPALPETISRMVEQLNLPSFYIKNFELVFRRLLKTAA